MLRTRNPVATPAGPPPNQFQGFPQGQNPAPGPRHQILRQQLRAVATQSQAQMQGQGFTGAPPNQAQMFQGQQQQMPNQGKKRHVAFIN